MRSRVGPAVALAVLYSTVSLAADLSIRADPYGTGGLFTHPLIAGEKEEVTITVRAAVEGGTGSPVPCLLSISAPDGETTHHDLLLELSEGQATGTHRWTPRNNGMYDVQATLDPGNEIGETDEANNSASLILPVVLPGRKPHFPWFGQRDYLRWPTIWAGGFKKEQIAHWQERGVMPLVWKWGMNHPKALTEDEYHQMYSDLGGTPGIAVDECGYYPETLDADAEQPTWGVGKFVTCLRGMQRANKENADAFFLVWQSGTFYPEQAAMYRKACDLLVLESYVTFFMPKGLYTESVYGALDMKMLPARQVDMLNATGKGPQVITSIDLRPENFHRGEVENIIRHLRRTWPEMRGFGIFGGLMPKDATEEQRRRAIADEQFVDRLYFRYFVPPVVTILPGSVWVTRDGGSRDYRVVAAVSNIGGMDAGRVRVRVSAGGRRLKTIALDRVPAGDSLLANRVVASVPWRPRSGNHLLEARIESAPGCTVVDARGEVEYFVER